MSSSARGSIQGRPQPTQHPRGLSRNASHQAFRKSGLSIMQSAKGDWQERYFALQRSRKREREDAIKRGLMADPDKPTTLAEAITLIGTCQDMCAEFERVERVVQKDIWKEEVDKSRISANPLDREPDESRMVKKFRRAAAGIEEQLPSDLRPPLTLQRTCKYLFNDVIGAASDLGSVHHFVWDRTRAIRNDFSIQQLTRPEDLAIAVNCYEQIARFHILSLHQLAVADKPYDKYDWQQEREQLDRTLLSLIQYYDDSRAKIALPNEAEFRAYCVIFQLRNPDPDLEDKVQSWPRAVYEHPRVRAALNFYAAACNTIDAYGPLKPAMPHATAQQDWHRVWQIIESKDVSYLMACVAEIHFNMIRETALRVLLKSTSAKATVQWTLDELQSMLAFDTEDGTVEFCARYGLTFATREGRLYLDFSNISGRSLPTANAKAAKQLKTQLVEQKRGGRLFPAVINGLTYKQASQQGMIVEEEDSEMGDGEERESVGTMEGEHSSDDGLFVSQANAKPSISVAASSPPASFATITKPSPFGVSRASTQDPQQSTFGKPSSDGILRTTGDSNDKVFSFGQQSAPAAPPNFAKNPFASTFVSGDNIKPRFGKPSAASENTEASYDKASAFTHEQPRQASPLPVFDFTAGLKKTTTPPASKEPVNSAGLLKPTSHRSQADDLGAQAESPTAHTAQSSPSFILTNTKGSINEQPQLLAQQHDALAQQTRASSESFGQTSPALVSNTTTKPLPSFDFAEWYQPNIKPVETATNLEDSSAHPTFAGLAKAPSAAAKSVLFAPFSSPFDKPSASTTSPNKQLEPATVPTNPIAPSVMQVPLFEADKGVNSLRRQAEQTKVAPKHQPVMPTAPIVDLPSVVTRLAQELTCDPKTGFLRQYVEFAINQVVEQVQEQVYMERLEHDAKLFRADVLTLRYGRRWREIYRHNRLARQARDRRSRAYKRLNDHKSQTSQDSATIGDDSIYHESVNTSRNTSKPRSKRDMIDELFQQTTGMGRWSKAAAEQAQLANSHRDSLESRMATNKHVRHQSAKITRVDNAGRVVKPTAHQSGRDTTATTVHYSPARSTTKSSYFHRKALGLDKVDALVSQSRKRSYSELSSNTSEPSWTSPLVSNVLAVQQIEAQPSETPESPRSKMLKMYDEEDALFARLRAARTELQEGMSFYKSELDKSASPPSNLPYSGHYDSPSMQKARQEARWRLSGATVPAYRLRESKFVPRRSEIVTPTHHSSPRSSVKPAIDFVQNPDADEHARPRNVESHTGHTPDVLQESESVAPQDNSYTNGHLHPLDHSLTSTLDHNGSTDHDVTIDDSGTDLQHSSVNHDFTIKPSQISDSLKASFGPPLEHTPVELAQDSFGIGPWQNSAGYTGTDISLEHNSAVVSDSLPEQRLTGDMTDIHMQLASVPVPSLSNHNPFAALQDHMPSPDAHVGYEYADEEQDNDSEAYTQEQGNAYENNQQFADDSDVSVDEEEDEESQADQNDYGRDEEEGNPDEDVEDDHDDESDVESDASQSPPTNEALQSFGGTEDDAIELSD